MVTVDSLSNANYYCIIYFKSKKTLIKGTLLYDVHCTINFSNVKMTLFLDLPDYLIEIILNFLNNNKLTVISKINSNESFSVTKMKWRDGRVERNLCTNNSVNCL